jgi:hypothetical protein
VSRAFAWFGWPSVAFILVVVTVLQFFGGGFSAQAYPEGAPVPEVFWPMYTAAADEYHVNPYLLASIHKQESEFSGGATGVASGVNDYGCCAGPMQFKVPGTWNAYKRAFAVIEDSRPATYPNDRRTLPSCKGVAADDGCVYDSFDAIAGAAMKLHADGADESLDSDGTHKAVCGYIGSCKEVDACRPGSPNRYCDVIPRARAWEQMGAGAGTQDVSAEIALDAPPRSLARVKAVADAISRQTERDLIPYCWGGGHGARPGPSSVPTTYCWEGSSKVLGSDRLGLDCSGSVRWLLTQSGFPDPGGIASGGYGRYLKPGRGKHVTFYYGAGHIYADIDGRIWQTSTQNKNQGPGWTKPRSAGPYRGVGHVEVTDDARA